MACSLINHRNGAINVIKLCSEITCLGSTSVSETIILGRQFLWSLNVVDLLNISREEKTSTPSVGLRTLEKGKY